MNFIHGLDIDNIKLMEKTLISRSILEKYPFLKYFKNATHIEIAKNCQFKNCGLIFNLHLGEPSKYTFAGDKKPRFVKKEELIKIFGPYTIDRLSLVFRIIGSREKIIDTRIPVFEPIYNPKIAELPTYINTAGYHKCTDLNVTEKNILWNLWDKNLQKLIDHYNTKEVNFLIYTQEELEDPRCKFLHRLHDMKMGNSDINAFYNLYELTNIPKQNEAFFIDVPRDYYMPEKLKTEVEKILKKGGMSLKEYIKIKDKSAEPLCPKVNFLFTDAHIEPISFCKKLEPMKFPDIGIKIYYYYDSKLDNFIRQTLSYPEDFGLYLYRKKDAFFPVNDKMPRDHIGILKPGDKGAPSAQNCYDIEDRRSMNLRKEHVAQLGFDFQLMIKKLLDFINTTIVPIDMDNYLLQLSTGLMKSGLKHHMDGFIKNGPVLVVFNLNTRIYYDLLPVFAEGDPTRISFNSGDVIYMSGESRYSWSHSYSSHTPLANKRYNIVFRGYKK